MRVPLVALCLAGSLAAAAGADAQILVDPTGVNVGSQGATTAFLTFGGLAGYRPAEAMWCGELVPAAPAIGLRCDPATIFGLLPARYDRSQASGAGALTDVMSVPASVARRAYQAAVAGHSSEFFYVRHFMKAGAPDQFVAVTCRLTAGGARVPLSLVDVELTFDAETPILEVVPGQRMPAVSAHLAYTGSGRLQGRWEIVLPGQEVPSPADLLTEATLPIDARGSQRRYTELGRFDVQLPPTGRATLAGPDPARLPTGVDGQYLLLFRVEATDDKEADSNLSAVGAGSGVVHAGGVAGFPMPVLRYVVGHAASGTAAPVSTSEVSPPDAAVFAAGDAIDLAWPATADARYYRIEMLSGGKLVHAAYVKAGAATYRVPPFVADKAAGQPLTWRIVAVADGGTETTVTSWRRLTIRPGSTSR